MADEKTPLQDENTEAAADTAPEEAAAEPAAETEAPAELTDTPADEAADEPADETPKTADEPAAEAETETAEPAAETDAEAETEADAQAAEETAEDAADSAENADTAAETADGEDNSVRSAESAVNQALSELDAMIDETAPESEKKSGKKKNGKKHTEKKQTGKNAADKLASVIKREKKPAKTIEEEIADLEEEEALFDEWGRPIRRKHKKKRRKSRKFSCTMVLLTLILALSSVLAVAILAIGKEIYGIDKDVQDKIIVIPEGATVTSIAEQLVDERMISLPQFFRLISRMNGMDGKYIAGEHVISASMSYQSMIEELCHNYEDERETVTVRFREGLTLDDAAKILQENQVCDAETFKFYFNAGGFGYKFEDYLPKQQNTLKYHRMEGYCFPDTYEFYVNEEPSIVAQKIYANFDAKLTEGDYRKIEELGKTLDEIITLASIVQAEAPNMNEMKMVSSVFHNRLNSPALFPQLQSDPTSKYAKYIAERLPVQNDLMVTAYDTYAHQGLPPGAICNPGKEAIEATLYPAETGYYFFNANINTREVFYAVTNEEHEANLAKVQQQYAEEEAAANGEVVNNNG